MKSITKTTAVLIMAILISKIALGVIAYPKPVEYILPDGSKITITLKGDEKVRWAETADGYSILLNDKGFYEYALLNDKGDMVRSGVRVSNETKRSSLEKQLLSKTPKGIQFSGSQVSLMRQIWEVSAKEASKAFPTTGERKLICLLIGFKDKAFTKTQAEFNDLFNQVGYSVGGATGSVKDYYLENSYNQFNLTVDVAGPYTAVDSMKYYGANSGGFDIRPRELVAEAVDLADADVDFSQYDNDGDQWVDGVYVIYAGYGEEAGGGDDAIWAHAWQMQSAKLKDGVYLQRYSCSAELRGNTGSNITRIGVICHEFGHVLGAPDYYDTDYGDGGQFSGTGQWDMMAGGSWNNSGATPAHHNGFTKAVIYEWGSVTTLESPETVTLLNAAENNNSFYRINTSTEDEYFLIENREKHLFDSYIPGSGMMIYHVHSGVFNVGNSINASHPQHMYPISQNASLDPIDDPASYGSINSSSCPWNGTGKTEFTDATLPSSKSWSGMNTNKPITNISRNAEAKTVSFDFMEGIPINFNASGVSTSQIDLSWELNIDSDPVVIAWTADNEFGVPEDGVAYSVGESIPGGGTVVYVGTDLSFQHTDLDINTRYYYKAWSLYNDDSYSPGTMANARTLCGVISSLPLLENFDESNQTPGCWDIIDNQENGQVWKFGTHADGLTGSTGNYAYLNSDAYGSSGTQNADLVSPLLDLTDFASVELSFQHYYRHYSGSKASLWYSIDGGGSWIEIESWEASTNNPITFSQVVSEVGGEPAVKFKWNFTGTWGYYWDIDDIVISNADAVEFTLTIEVAGDGNVEVDEVEYTIPITVFEGESLSIEALPGMGYMFNGWTGDLESSNASESITMDSDKTIIATFIPIPQFTLTVNIIGEGEVNVDGFAYSSPISAYQDVEMALTATSFDNYEFEGWSGDLVSTSASELVVMNADKSITATFTQITGVDNDQVFSTRVYPNPFQNSIKLANAESVKRVIITNIIGQKLIDRELNGTKDFTIQTHNLGKGIYLVTLYNINGQRQVRKLIKE